MAVGVGFLILALFFSAWRLVALLTAQGREHLLAPPAIYFTGAFIAASALFAFTGVTIILRWRGWQTWASTAAWLLMVLALFSVSSTIDVWHFLSRINRAQTAVTPRFLWPIFVTPFMVLFSIFVLWVRHREKPLHHTDRSGEVTVAGVVLLLVGIIFGIVSAVMIVSSKAAADSRLGGGSIRLFVFGTYATAGLATIWRWRGWRTWAGTASWLMIVALVIGFSQKPIQVLTTYGFAAFGYVLVGTGETYIFISSMLTFIFVLWAKRQEKALTSG